MLKFEKTDQIIELLLTERKQGLTEEEQLILDEWMKEDKGNQALYDLLRDEANISAKLQILSEFNKDQAYSEFVELTKVRKTRSIYREVLKYAAVLIPFFFITWFVFQKNNKSETQLVETEIQPGTSKAILRLTDGTIVNLEGKKELIAEFDGTIISNNNKEIIYKPSTKKVKRRKLQFNTLEIPRGGEYQLTLSDGTKVWLNSDTKIKYPVAFAANSREVYLEEGEVFLEVAKDISKPFKLISNGQIIKVLGTSFNVSAYSDEDYIQITLVEGKVNFLESDASDKPQILLPNEQLTFDKQTGSFLKKTVNPLIYTSWKEGIYYFEDVPLQQIMKTLSRWYNYEVIFNDTVVAKTCFGGKLKRMESLDNLLGFIGATSNIQFEIENNTIRVQ